MNAAWHKVRRILGQIWCPPFFGFTWTKLVSISEKDESCMVSGEGNYKWWQIWCPWVLVFQEVFLEKFNIDFFLISEKMKVAWWHNVQRRKSWVVTNLMSMSFYKFQYFVFLHSWKAWSYVLVRGRNYERWQIWCPRVSEAPMLTLTVGPYSTPLLPHPLIPPPRLSQFFHS